MKKWTFLLQKDGDRSWLPLDSPDVEILEGRYRIVAQTDQPNTDISIRICHLATEENPPKRRIQKRNNRTNDSGLMVVIPFTHLQSGCWELSCFLTDPLSDLVGDTLHHAVRLRVSSPVMTDEAEDWEIAPSNSTQLPEDGACIEPKNTQVAISPAVSVPSKAPTAHDLAVLNVEIAQALGVSMDRLVEMTDQLSHQLIAEIFKEFKLAPEIVGADDTPREPLTLTVGEAPVEPAEGGQENSEQANSERFDLLESVDVAALQIQLERAVWMAKRGESLAIAGYMQLTDTPSLEPLSTLEWSESDLAGAVPREIQMQLRDPQTSEIVFHACQSFPTKSLPFPFSFLCRLPEDLTTHLLLGEVLVAGALPGADTVLVTLKTFNFTVTVDPEALVEELHKVTSALEESSDSEELTEAMVQLSSRLQKEKARQGLDLSFLNLAPAVTEQSPKVSGTPVPVRATVAAGQQILPPQLYQPDANSESKRKLELPRFVSIRGQTATAIAEPAAAIAEEAVFNLAESGLDLMLSSDADLSASEPESQSLDSVASLLEQSLLSEASTNDNHAYSAPEPSAIPEPFSNSEAKPQSPDCNTEDLSLLDELSFPVRSAFQALNLQERFLNRLSAIAADTELAMLLKQAMPPTEESDTQSPITVDPGTEAATPELVQGLPTDEIVVEDDPSWREWLKRAGSRTKRVETTEPEGSHVDALISANPMVLPKDEPVPVPTLEILADEIVAGRLLQVRVKLPDIAPKIYVKLWVNDRQTRSLLDGPRWLVDFLPNGFGELEANTQLIAPLGTLAMRVEAIAVEMQTQRESQKVSLDREVLPADMPDDVFGDLDLQGLNF
ncbi:hypothetical protein OsccyDRAFT_2989 [Leptolyngbyaceae cyanobacterium JSC-12]|nr:hypothetical protein OsccyDRAFT_2989 [Leptolyngbyaceae cyanobacterium JSC-12]